MNKYKFTLFLVLLFLLSFALHLYHLDLLSLYVDETSHFKVLNYILDNKQNLVSRIINVLIYGPLSFTWLLGLNHYGVRAPSALFGSIAILALFIFAKPLSKKNSVSVVLAVIAAVIPWLFMLSRLGHTQVIVLVIIVCLHVYFLLRSSRVRDYLTSLAFLFLSAVYYPSTAVIVPPIFLLVVYYMFKEIPKKHRQVCLLVGTMTLIIFGIFVSSRYSLFSLGGRGLDLAIWRDVNTPWEIDKFRALSWNSTPSIFSFGLPPEQLANKLFLNRATANLSIFTKNYLSFFSPDWLFLKGDPILRHSTGMVGAFYPFLSPFMLYGAFKFFGNSEKKKKITFLLWILVSPIPAAITKDGAGYLLRVVTMLPFLTYFCALGIVESFNLIGKKWRSSYGIVIAMVGLYSSWSFFCGYFHVYPALSAKAYEYGFRELSDFQVSHQNKTMLVIWDGYYHNNDFRFWQKTPFDQYESFKTKQIVIGESTFWQTYPNLYFTSPKSAEEVKDFIKQYQPSFVVLPDRYFVKYPEEISLILSVKPVEQIRYPDQTTALSIYTVR